MPPGTFPPQSVPCELALRGLPGQGSGSPKGRRDRPVIKRLCAPWPSTTKAFRTDTPVSVSDPSEAPIGRNSLSFSAKTDRVRNIETPVQLPIPPIRPGTYANFLGYDRNVRVCSTLSRESGATEAGREPVGVSLSVFKAAAPKGYSSLAPLERRNSTTASGFQAAVV